VLRPEEVFLWAESPPLPSELKSVIFGKVVSIGISVFATIFMSVGVCSIAWDLEFPAPHIIALICIFMQVILLYNYIAGWQSPDFLLLATVCVIVAVSCIYIVFLLLEALSAFLDKDVFYCITSERALIIKRTAFSLTAKNVVSYYPESIEIISRTFPSSNDRANVYFCGDPTFGSLALKTMFVIPIVSPRGGFYNCLHWEAAMQHLLKLVSKRNFGDAPTNPLDEEKDIYHEECRHFLEEMPPKHVISLLDSMDVDSDERLVWISHASVGSEARTQNMRTIIQLIVISVVTLLFPPVSLAALISAAMVLLANYREGATYYILTNQRLTCLITGSVAGPQVVHVGFSDYKSCEIVLLDEDKDIGHFHIATIQDRGSLGRASWQLGGEYSKFGLFNLQRITDLTTMLQKLAGREIPRVSEPKNESREQQESQDLLPLHQESASNPTSTTLLEATSGSLLFPINAEPFSDPFPYNANRGRARLLPSLSTGRE
jgi:hypothetical protein